MKLGQQHVVADGPDVILTQVRHRVSWGHYSYCWPLIPAAAAAWDVLTWLGFCPERLPSRELMGGSVAEGFLWLVYSPTATQRSPTPAGGLHGTLSVRAPELATPCRAEKCAAPTALPPHAPPCLWLVPWHALRPVQTMPGKGDSPRQRDHSSASVPGLLPVLTGSTGRKAGL